MKKNDIYHVVLLISGEVLYAGCSQWNISKALWHLVEQLWMNWFPDRDTINAKEENSHDYWLRTQSNAKPWQNNCSFIIVLYCIKLKRTSRSCLRESEKSFHGSEHINRLFHGHRRFIQPNHMTICLCL